MDDSTLDLERLTGEAKAAVAAAGDLQALDQIRVGYLGKSGHLTAQLKQLEAFLHTLTGPLSTPGRWLEAP